MPRRLRVLVVEDLSYFYPLWEDVCEIAGMDHRVAPNAEEAKVLLAAEKFDAAVLDIFMPATTLGGLGLLDEILKDPSFLHMKLHVYSGIPRGHQPLTEVVCKLREKRGVTFWSKDGRAFKGPAILEVIKEQVQQPSVS